jgi:hypothetical protein
MVTRSLIITLLLLRCSVLGQGFGFTFFDQPWMGRVYEDLVTAACVPTKVETLISQQDWAVPYPVTICVTNTETITNISLTLSNYSHNFSTDVGVVLSLRTATTNWAAVGVMFDAMGGNEGFLAPVNLVLDDSAVNSLPQTVFPTNGNYKPTVYAARDMVLYQYYPGFTPGYDPFNVNTGDTNYLGFTNFIGKSPVGTWEVFVWDFVPNDGGAIHGWILTINGGPNYAGPGAQ